MTEQSEMSSTKILSRQSNDVKAAASESEIKPTTMQQDAQQRIAIERSLSYINSLVANDLQPVFFDETLKTFSDTNQEVGQLRISISPVTRDDEEMIFVQATSLGIVDGISCGTRICAALSMLGETVEQKHHEYVNLTSNAIKRNTCITLEGDLYNLESTIQRADEEKNNSTSYSIDEMKTVIPEGSNLLLQRLMAIKGLPTEGLEIHMLNADMAICTARYRSLTPTVMKVENKEFPVVGIERTLYSDNDQPITWQSYYRHDGRLVQRTQLGSTITMRLCDLGTEDEEDVDDDKRPEIKPEPLNWETDLELKSKFLDRMEELKADHTTYLRRHPEVHSIVADFLQFVLFRKPSDVLQVSSEFFSTFQVPPSQRPTRAKSLSTKAFQGEQDIL